MKQLTKFLFVIGIPSLISFFIIDYVLGCAIVRDCMMQRACEPYGSGIVALSIIVIYSLFYCLSFLLKSKSKKKK